MGGLVWIFFQLSRLIAGLKNGIEIAVYKNINDFPSKKRMKKGNFYRLKK